MEIDNEIETRIECKRKKVFPISNIYMIYRKGIMTELVNSDVPCTTYMETLDKLENFKRFSIALVLIGIFGLAIAVLGIGILVLIYKGDYDAAIEASKWMITVLGTVVGTIVGFYFGSKTAQVNNSGAQ